MTNNKRWAVFFSQSGQEVADLCKEFDKYPSLIIASSPRTRWSQDFKDLVDHLIETRFNKFSLFYVPPKLAKNVNVIGKYLQDNQIELVTLHGWLFILPKMICDQYDIYNGHPGDIVAHPSLKGKDPQVKAWQEKHSAGGSVVHKVIAEVDEGEVVARRTTDISNLTLDEVYEKLRRTSLSAWRDFFLNDQQFTLKK